MNHKFNTKQTARILQQHDINPYNEDTDSLIDLLKPYVINSRRRWSQRGVDECSDDNEDDEVEEEEEIEESNDDYDDEDDDETASNVSSLSLHSDKQG